MEANDPDQAKMLLPQIDQDVASLRANVSRLPAPVSGWMEKVAKDAAGDVSTANIQQIADSMAQEVTAPCQLAIANKYPFNPKGPDIPLADFANLFKPGGVIDRFYLTNLAPLASMAGKTWTWKPNPNLPHKLPDATLRQFQLAADIRDAFFPTGGSLPNVSLEVKMLSLNSNAQTSTLVVNGGAPIVSQSSTPASAVLQWPGAGASGASITLAPELPDQKSSIERQGAWALFRLIDAGAVTPRGQSTNVGFVVGGRDVSYQFNVNTANSPLTMPSLRQFKCPNGL
jgi:type VI secretion system protein ImpL